MLYEEAARVLTVPYVLNGMDTEGWDCRGLVAWCRNTWLSLPSPGMDGWYPVEKAIDPDFVETAMKDRMDAWTESELVAGAVVMFSVRERVAHVGLLLDSHNFLHTRETCGTCVDTLHNKKWSRRFEGAYELR